MTVYIDNARIPYGRMIMCHMLADTRAELEAMAKAIDLPKSAAIQHPGAPNEHIDLSATYRDKAMTAGAVEITGRAMVKLIRRKRKALAATGDPERIGKPGPCPKTGEGTCYCPSKMAADDPRLDVHTPPAPEDIPDMDLEVAPEKKKGGVKITRRKSDIDPLGR